MTLAVIDVDRFKMLNDNHGHASGDVVLRKIGATLRESFRQSDTVGRYGGEEFVAILPEMELEAGRQKLESLRQRLAHTRIAIPHRNEQVQITISVGLSTFPGDGEDAARLFSLADKRMFRAKRQGRNQVVANESAPPNPAPPSERSLLERTPWQPLRPKIKSVIPSAARDPSSLPRLATNLFACVVAGLQTGSSSHHKTLSS